MFWNAQLCWLNKIWEWNWKFEAWERIVWPKLEIGNRNPLNNTSFAPSLASFPMNPGVNPASPVPLSHKAPTFGLWDRSLEYLRRSFECPRGTPFGARGISNGKFESWFAGWTGGTCFIRPFEFCKSLSKCVECQVDRENYQVISFARAPAAPAAPAVSAAQNREPFWSQNWQQFGLNKI